MDSKYMLSGFARCALCGGTLSVVSRSHGKRRLYLYGRLAHSKRGATVCSNAVVLPIERVESAVIATLSRAFTPAVIRAVIAGVFDALQPQTLQTNVASLRRELQALDVKIDNLTVAVESGAALAPVVAKLAARQAEREGLLASIAATEAIEHRQWIVGWLSSAC
jgi:hypothetical protein